MNIEIIKPIWENPKSITKDELLRRCADLCDAIGHEGMSDYTEIAGMLFYIINEHLREFEITTGTY